MIWKELSDPQSQCIPTDHITSCHISTLLKYLQRCNCNTQTEAAGGHLGTHNPTCRTAQQPWVPPAMLTTNTHQSWRETSLLVSAKAASTCPWRSHHDHWPKNRAMNSRFQRGSVGSLPSPPRAHTLTDPALMSSALQTRALTSTQQLQTRKRKVTKRSLSCQVLTQKQHSSLLWPANSN